MTYLVDMAIYLPDAIYKPRKKVEAESAGDAAIKATKIVAEEMCIARRLIEVKDITLKDK